MCTLKPHQVDFDLAWNKLVRTVDRVLQCEDVAKETWTDTFFTIYSLCVAAPEPHCGSLYTHVNSFLQQHCQAVLQRLDQVPDVELLAAYHRSWRTYYDGSSYLHRLFRYLNVHHVQKKQPSDADLCYGGMTRSADAHTLEVFELAMDIWYRMLQQLAPRLCPLVLAQIELSRRGVSIDGSRLSSVVQSFVDVVHWDRKRCLTFYTEQIEQLLLAQTAEFYAAEGDALFARQPVHRYIELVLQLLREDGERMQALLHPSSVDKVRQEAEQKLVENFLPQLNQAAVGFVEQEESTNLANLFQLTRSLPEGHKELRRLFEAHICSAGEQALATVGSSEPAAAAQEFVDGLRQLHEKFKAWVRGTFNDDAQFDRSLDLALSKVVNQLDAAGKKQCKSPELLARYVDAMLRKSSKAVSDSELEEKLSQCIGIFKYVEDKDVFQRHYQRLLSKRLILGVSHSSEAEEGMISKLKSACGYEFTSKFQRMFHDVRLSESQSSDFADAHGRDALGISLHVFVLTQGAWPLQASNTPFPRLPSPLERGVTLFQRYYTNKFQGRRLTWLHAHGTADMKLKFSRTYSATVGAAQAILLLQFNDLPASRTLSLADLANAVGVGEAELQRCLAPLIDCGILQADATGQQLHVNQEFHSKRSRLRVLPAPAKEAEKEQERVASQIQEDRKFFLQAAIVRIMKDRKRLNFNSLTQLVLVQTTPRFKPEVKMIKTCIESLIEKEYLTRSQAKLDEISYNG
uniref:CULLIN_2 domain-containing protein n=2 Tax=Macrostomum lignano TaxID=282301 RepID=A0A1I8JBD7_9PLAT